MRVMDGLGTSEPTTLEDYIDSLTLVRLNKDPFSRQKIRSLLVILIITADSDRLTNTDPTSVSSELRGLPGKLSSPLTWTPRLTDRFRRVDPSVTSEFGSSPPHDSKCKCFTVSVCPPPLSQDSFTYLQGYENQVRTEVNSSLTREPLGLPPGDHH